MSVHRNIITNYSQQDATFLKFIYFYRRSTCFRRFLRPSSGAHNCTYGFKYCQPILLLAATVEEMALVEMELQFHLDLHTGRPLTQSDYTRSCIHTNVLIMMSTKVLETCREFK